MAKASSFDQNISIAITSPVSKTHPALHRQSAEQNRRCVAALFLQAVMNIDADLTVMITYRNELYKMTAEL